MVIIKERYHDRVLVIDRAIQEFSMIGRSNVDILTRLNNGLKDRLGMRRLL